MTASITFNATSILSEGSSSDPVRLSSPLAVAFTGSASQMRPIDMILRPSQSASLIDGVQPITYSSITNWTVSVPRALEPSTVRLTADSAVFRTKRALALSNTTLISIVRQSTSVVRVLAVSGTFDTTSVVIGDTFLVEKTTDAFTSPFADANQGLSLTIVNKTGTSLDVYDNGVLVPDSNIDLNGVFNTAMKVLAPGAAAQDMLYVYSTTPLFSNQGRFLIATASDDYVEYASAESVLDSFTSIPAGGIVVARDAAQYVFLTASGSVEVLTGNQQLGSGTKITSISGANAVALLTVSSPVLVVHNPSLVDQIRIVAHVASSPASEC